MSPLQLASEVHLGPVSDISCPDAAKTESTSTTYSGTFYDSLSAACHLVVGGQQQQINAVSAPVLCAPTSSYLLY